MRSREPWQICLTPGFTYTVRWEPIGETVGWVACDADDNLITGAWKRKVDVMDALRRWEESK